jgi:amidase
MVEALGLEQAAALLADGGLSSRELVARTIEAIESAQPSLNAFRLLRRDAAMAEAAAADRRLAAGERAPLLGVPIAVKDDTDVAGEPTAFGCAGDFPPAPADAAIVRRLREAGAVIVGKTNTPEFGQWPFTEGAAFGVTRNPWNLMRSPGGSSGGSAAAVAAGLVPAATGSDGLGSIRIPSAWTGLVGIKPGRGVVRDRDMWNGIATHGPLARTAGDAALLLDILAESGTTMRDAAKRRPGRLRIALALRAPFTAFPTTLHPEVSAGTISIARTLVELGHEIVLASPHYGLVGLGAFPRSLAALHEWSRNVPDITMLDQRTRENASLGRWLGGPALRAVMAMESWHRRVIGRIFSTADVLLAPTTATPPTPIGHYDGRSNLGTTRAMINACPYAWPWNILGLPAINVPAGLTEDGMPVGAQLVGAEGAEPLLISLAAELEPVRRWHESRPRWTDADLGRSPA